MDDARIRASSGYWTVIGNGEQRRETSSAQWPGRGPEDPRGGGK